MSLFKAIFGGNDDKKNLPVSNPEKDNSKELIPLEELYRLDEMQNIEGLELPERATQQQSTTLTEPAQLKGIVNPNGGIQQSKSSVEQNVANQPKGTFAKPPFVPKPVVVDTKLTIILVENTNEVAKEKDKLKAIVKKLVTTGYICVINYGTLVRKSEILEAKNFDCDKLIYKGVVGDNACLFDAIDTLEDVVKENYKKSEEIKNKRVRTQSIDIIGIGRCFDNCSITPREIASESFCRVARYTDVTTKYFCLTEDSFIAAATIGFHSIGAIAKNYM